MEKFDKIISNEIDIRRKWDKKIIENKFNLKLSGEFIPLWIADMDFLHPIELQDALIEYIKKSNLGYTYLTDNFYASIINWQEKRHGIKIKKEWINIGYGTVSTLHLLNQVFLEKEEYIIVNTPCYEPFYTSAKNNGNNVVFSDLKIIDNRYYFDYEDIEKKIKKYKPKLYILCNPHNPSGRVWSKEEIEKIAKLCYENKVILVSDEVHSEIILENKHTSALSLEKKYLENLIFLTSPNKAFNLGGLKTSYSIIKNNEIRQKFEQGMKKNSITSPNILGLVSLITVYNKCEYWLNDLIKYINNNYKYCKEYIDKNLKKFKIMNMESSYLLWIYIGEDKEKILNKMINRKLLVEDGVDFLQNHEGYIRVNLGISFEYIVKFLDILKEIYQEIYGV